MKNFYETHLTGDTVEEILLRFSLVDLVIKLIRLGSSVSQFWI